MRIGVIGSGLMGSKLGTILARAGHEVVFSYARTESKLERLAQEAGGRARNCRRRVLVLPGRHWRSAPGACRSCAGR